MLKQTRQALVKYLAREMFAETDTMDACQVNSKIGTC